MKNKTVRFINANRIYLIMALMTSVYLCMPGCGKTRAESLCAKVAEEYEYKAHSSDAMTGKDVRAQCLSDYHSLGATMKDRLNRQAKRILGACGKMKGAEFFSCAKGEIAKSGEPPVPTFSFSDK